MRALAILTLRNEGPYVLDWLAHHRACGFTDFLVFSNDCDDGTDAMLDRLTALGEIAHVPNPGPHPQGPQWAALKQAERHPLLAAADWVLVCDIDEFVNIHTGDRTLAALLEALPKATAIPLTWRMFGNCGITSHDDQPVTEVFTRAAPAVLQWPWRAALFKTLYRNDGSYRKPGVHRPRSPDRDRMATQRWFDGSGRELPAAFHRGRIFSDFGQDNYALAQLNHYALGAMDSFLIKRDRGRANRDASAFDMGYWIDRNFCQAEDRSILAMAPRISPVRDRLRADPVLVRLHAAARDWHRARFAALMAEEPWRAFYGRLLLAPPSRALSPAEVALILRHRPDPDAAP